MDIKLNLNKNFVACLNKLREKYGEDFEKINGFHNSNLNFTDFIDKFVDSKNVADVTIDANANSNTHDIRTLMSDMMKPHTKLLAANKIFYEITKKYGLQSAEEWLEGEWNGETYLHDFPSATFMPYCYAYDLEDVVNKGLFFINKFKTDPPKHLTTFNDHVLEFISWTSNRCSGAVGLPSYLVYSYYFWQHDVKNGFYLKDPEYYREQCFQKFIYDLNQPYLRVTECAFTNISIMDRNYLTELFGGREFPDGEFVIDHIEDIIEHQKVFMNVVSKVRSETMMTFPVLTYSLLYQNNKFADEDFARWCNKHNMDWFDSNFYVGSDVTSLSNCCFDGSQMCLSKNKNGVNYMSFKDLFDANREKNGEISAFHNGSWIKAKIIKLAGRKMYKVVTSNKKEMIVTDNHIFPTLNGDKQVKDINTDDYLMFNCRKLDTFPEKDKKLTYEEGYLIGMYLGDGSCYHKNESNTPIVALSLNESKYACSKKLVDAAICKIDEDCEFKLGKSYNNVYPTTITSWAVYNFIKEYVSGNYCYEKELNMNCLLQSANFRRGILDGYYATDGGNSNRIYTTSKNLVGQIEALVTSLGMNTVVDRTDRTDEPVIIRGQSFNRNYPLYCIRWYNPANKRSSCAGFLVRNNSEYFKVISIEELEDIPENVYCFEIANKDEPYFTLPNGVITHNCRLVSDTSKLDAFINSIGGTALSVGSIKVNTINLRRIALESEKNEEKYIEILKNRVLQCCKTLDVIRSIIKRNVEKGLLPNYTYGLIEMGKQYNTVGITAMYEALEDFGYISCDEFGNKSYSDDAMRFSKTILNTINSAKDEFSSTKDYSVNVECIPAERANVILAKKDREVYPESVAYHIYSNQWIPLTENCTIDEKIRLGAILDKECGGGRINLAT